MEGTRSKEMKGRLHDRGRGQGPVPGPSACGREDYRGREK